MSTSDVLKKYFSRHNDQYLASLDSIIEKLKQKNPTFISAKTKLVIPIAAMNETNLKDTVDALQKAYQSSYPQGSFNDEVTIVLFHNYKGDLSSIDPAVQTSISEVTKLPNVFVFEEQVPQSATVGFAKKIVTDVALRSMQKEKIFPSILRADADITELSSQFIRAGLEALNSPYTIAVSPTYDYDRDSQQTFPVWGFRSSLLKNIRNYETVKMPIKQTFLLGGATFISPRSIALIGGVQPIFFEDKAVLTSLRDVTSYLMYEFDPGVTINETIYFNPSKELTHIANGELAETHWTKKEEGLQESGALRPNWKNLQHSDTTPLLATSLTTANKVAALQDAYSLMSQSVPSDRTDGIQMITIYFLRSFIDLQINDVAIHLNNNQVLKNIDQIKEFLKKVQHSDGTYFSFYEINQSFTKSTDKWSIESFSPEQHSEINLNSPSPLVNFVSSLQIELDKCDLSYRTIPHVYADKPVNQNVLGINTGCLIPPVFISPIQILLSILTPPGAGSIPTTKVRNVSEAICTNVYHGCYIAPKDNLVSSCIPDRVVDTKQTCCKGRFFAGECIEVNHDFLMKFDQKAAKWQTMEVNESCTGERVSANHACGPFAVAGIINTLNHTVFTPDTMNAFIRENYQGGICNGTNIDMNLQTLSSIPNITTRILYSDKHKQADDSVLEGFKNELRIHPDTQIFVGGTFNGIKHFAVITGINVAGEFIFNDSFFDEYTSRPEIFEAVAVTKATQLPSTKTVVQ